MIDHSRLLFEAQGPVEQVELEVKQEFSDELDIRCVVGKVLVEFRSCCPDLGQVVPRAGREIMVFNVVSQIQVEEIPRTKVVISFHSFDNFEVLGDCVSGGGVGTNGEEGYEEEVQNCIRTPEFEN